MIWLAFGVMALAVVAALLWPLLRAKPGAERAAYDLAVFRDQLQELDRDLAREALTPAEADAARLEIHRRMLSASKSATTDATTDSPALRANLTAAVAVLVPFVALGAYLSLGSPQLPSRGPAAQDMAGAANADMVALVDQLAARMAADPNNAEGWALLARSYTQLDRYEDAAAAYRHVLTLTPDDPTALINFGETSIAVANGTVTPEAHDALMAGLARDRTEPRAQFYLGLEQVQKGDARTAIAIWRALTAAAPADAPWLQGVRDQMAEVAQQAGIPPMGVDPRHALEALGGAPAQTAAVPAAPAPTSPAPAGAASGSGQFTPENLAMIQGMVGSLAAKLASDPSNYDGWMMLGRSYTVLQDKDGAKQAYEKAMALKPAEVAPKLQYAAVLLADVDLDATGPLPAPVTAAMSDVLRVNPAQPDALFIMGLTKAKAGDAAGAKAMWAQAQQGLPADAPLRAEIARRLQTLN